MDGFIGLTVITGGFIGVMTWISGFIGFTTTIVVVDVPFLIVVVEFDPELDVDPPPTVITGLVEVVSVVVDITGIVVVVEVVELLNVIDPLPAVITGTVLVVEVVYPVFEVVVVEDSPVDSLFDELDPVVVVVVVVVAEPVFSVVVDDPEVIVVSPLLEFELEPVVDSLLPPFPKFTVWLPPVNGIYILPELELSDPEP